MCLTLTKANYSSPTCFAKSSHKLETRSQAPVSKGHATVGVLYCLDNISCAALTDIFKLYFLKMRYVSRSFLLQVSED